MLTSSILLSTSVSEAREAKIGARLSVQLSDEVVNDVGNLPCGLVEQHLDVVYVLQNKESCAFAPCCLSSECYRKARDISSDHSV